MDLFEEYEQAMEPARKRFAEGHGLTTMMSADIEPRRLHQVLLEFVSRGVKMTEPVEGWIRTAAEGCQSTGLTDLARFLKGHASSEAGHHLMMVADTHALVALWNTRHSPTISAEALLCREAGEGAGRYIALHEQVISGPRPFLQVALQYEIEQLPVAYGEPLMRNWLSVLGEEAVECLSFVREHAILDVGHSELNRNLMRRVLKARPEAIGLLVEAGSSILDAYGEFLTNCSEDPVASAATASLEHALV